MLSLFPVAYVPAVWFDLIGGLQTCLYLIIYQEYSVNCIFAERM